MKYADCLNILLYTVNESNYREYENLIKSSKNNIKIISNENDINHNLKIDLAIIEFNKESIYQILKKVNKNNKKIVILIFEDYIDNPEKDTISKYGTVFFLAKNTPIQELRINILNHINNLENERLNYELSTFIKYEKRTFKIPNSIKYVSPICEHLTRDLSVLGIIDKDRLLGIRFGIQEMLINAIEHGNLEINFDEKSKLQEDGVAISDIIERKAAIEKYSKKKVIIKFTLTRKKAVFTIKDQGKGFDTKKFMEKINDQSKLTLEHGRGILLTRNNFDEFYYNDIGNEVTLVIYKKKK